MGMPYNAQLQGKLRHTRQVLSPFGKGQQITWLEPFSSPQTAFRNKAKMIVSGSKKDIRLGLAPTSKHPRGVDLEDCPLYPESIRAAFAPLRDYLTRLGVRPYQIEADKGEVKNVQITSNPEGELMIRLVLRSKAALNRVKNTWAELREVLPHLEVFSVNIQPEHAALLAGQEEILLSDERFLKMPGVGAELRLAPNAFFQTNTAAALTMYQQAATWTRTIQPQTAWDLYCGVGGFAFAVGSATEAKVTGVEMAGAAIEGAKASASATSGEATSAKDVPENGQTLVESTPHFITADATKWIKNQKHLETPDLVVVNPPRRGLGSELAKWMEKSGIPHVIYSSCYQPTLVSDLQRMRSYRLKDARLIDMFPHTRHVETVCLLSRKMV